MPRKIIIVLAALGFLLSAAAHADAPETKNGLCSADSRVIVEIKGVRLAVPRTEEYHISLDDGITRMALSRPGPGGYTCDTPVIPNVRGLTTGDYTVGSPTRRRGSSDQRFTAARRSILGADALYGNKVAKLPNGIRKTDAPAVGAQFFLLPLDAAPTGDGIPVAILCDNTESKALAAVIQHLCSVYYIHPSGLPFSYVVDHADYPTDDFIAADKANRKVLDDMIAAAKNKKDSENNDK